MTFDPSVTPFSLADVRAKQREFIEVLERQVKRGGDAQIDLFALGNEVGIVPMLVVEFLYYWMGMGRLHKSWSGIARKMQDELTRGPLKPPASMLATADAGKERSRISRDQEQRRVYEQLWQDIISILETRHTSQIPFAEREKGIKFHLSQMEPGYDGVKKVDRLSPYLEADHQEAIRDYFNALCNYHHYRMEKYQDENEADPSGWNDQDKLLYGRVFGRGQLEITELFRDVLAGQELETTVASVGSIHMGDNYTAGQAGAMGPGSAASHMNFQQVWNQMQGSVKTDDLAKELGTLRAAMRSEASEPEHEISIGAVAAAEKAAKAGNGAKALEYLKASGKWGLDVATKIGVTVVSSLLESIVGPR